VDEFGRSYTWGSRKTAKAQTWIVEGSGSLYVNGVPMADYFAEEVDREAVVKPLELARCVGNYNVWAVVQGGGLSGQAGAVALAVARGLIIHEPQVEPLLKEAGLLTPDTRQVERKKTGQPKARKKYTWVKR
ncbi:mitochondrial ribosomal protein subunit S9, partial [Gaertneriomyces semiglobifer]